MSLICNEDMLNVLKAFLLSVAGLLFSMIILVMSCLMYDYSRSQAKQNVVKTEPVNATSNGCQ